MYEFLDYRVEGFMTPRPVTISPEASLADAEKLFEAHGFNGLPVVNDAGELVGLLTKLDVLRAFRFTEAHIFPPYEEIMERRVEEVMDTKVRTVTPRAPLTRVLQTLVRTRFKSLVVKEGGQPVGMVSREDVLGALRRAAEGERAGGPARAETS